MKFYNIHNIHQDQMESTVNSHIRKGYEFQGWRNAGGQRVQVVFFKEFVNVQQLDQYAGEQLGRRVDRQREREAAKREAEALRRAAQEPAA